MPPPANAKPLHAGTADFPARWAPIDAFLLDVYWSIREGTALGQLQCISSGRGMGIPGGTTRDTTEGSTPSSSINGANTLAASVAALSLASPVAAANAKMHVAGWMHDLAHGAGAAHVLHPRLADGHRALVASQLAQHVRAPLDALLGNPSSEEASEVPVPAASSVAATSPVLFACDVAAVFGLMSKAYSSFLVWQRFLRTLFQGLDQHQPVPTKKTKAVEDELFRTAVYDKVKVAMARAVNNVINTGRGGNRMDLAEVRTCVRLFTDLAPVGQLAGTGAGVFEQDFQQPFLASMKTYYLAAAQRQMADDPGLFTYLRWVESRFQFEGQLVRDLSQSMWDKVSTALTACLLTPNLERLVNSSESGMNVLLADDLEEDLRRMYRLLRNVPDDSGVKLMRDCYAEHIASRMAALYDASSSETGEAADRALVEAISAFLAQQGALVRSAFQGDFTLLKVITEAVTKALMKPVVRKEAQATKEVPFAEVLSAYADALVRKDIKDLADHAAELKRIDEIVDVFSHIADKDVFAESYSMKLARRLLQTTPNDELEKAMLERLTRKMGRAYTYRMTAMVQDRDATQPLNERFKKSAFGAGLAADASVQVLTASHWPPYKTDALTPPASLGQIMAAFSSFYRQGNAARKLNWISMLGQAQVTLTYPKNAVKDVQCSLLQAAVLSTLSGSATGSLTVQAIADALAMDVKAVKSQIGSMYLSRGFNLLTVVVVGAGGQPALARNTIGDSDVFMCNPGFTHKLRKFKLPPAAGARPSTEVKSDEMDALRKVQVDACIVRVMKSRRTLQHQALVGEVTQQLSRLFVPTPALVKARIEDLITRAYLKRKDDDRAVYEYLA